jgi:glycosidase
MQKVKDSLQPDDIHMNFTSNHDENSWNGTEYERMNNAVEVFTALTYVMPGVPLIYNGQEYDLKKRLKFFEKDTIPHTVGKMMPIYEKLGKLKIENPALHGGKKPASYTRLETSANDKILAFERQQGKKKVIFVANLTRRSQKVQLPLQGNLLDYMTGRTISFSKETKTQLEPWQYFILIN